MSHRKLTNKSAFAQYSMPEPDDRATVKALHALLEKHMPKPSKKSGPPIDRDTVMRLTRHMKREYWTPPSWCYMAGALNPTRVVVAYLIKFDSMHAGELNRLGLDGKKVASIAKRWCKFEHVHDNCSSTTGGKTRYCFYTVIPDRLKAGIKELGLSEVVK